MDLQDGIDRLSRILAEIIRQLRPDIALLYNDYESLMVADLLAECSEDRLVEELMGVSSGMLVT